MNLTARQGALVRELDELTTLLELNYRDCQAWRPDSRTTKLDVAKNTMIRGQIVLSYTLYDEFLASAVAQYFFGRSREFPALWRTKKFRCFNYFILERLSFLDKLKLVKQIMRLPPRLVKTAEALNEVRNAVAHALFPENLRTPPTYRGHSVLSLRGVEALNADMNEVFGFFWRRLGFPND